MKIVSVIGARPQFIKAAAVSREFAKHPEIEDVTVHTGQHFDHNMSDIFFEELEIPRPKYHFEINSLSHGVMTGRMLEKIERVLLKEKPDYVLVYGDTNTTLAGALAAKKLYIRIAHIEAGLRSFNMKMPEEVNRIITDRLSDILFCPTDRAVENLKKEGFGHYPCILIKVGDVMQDAALYYAEKAGRESTVISRLGIDEKPFALCTVHREENTIDRRRLAGIVEALNTLSREMRIVFPLHPRTRKILKEQGIATTFPLIEPVGYLDMIMLLKNCRIVLTDSGGLQKEAFFFRKPCVTLRDETEWVELTDGNYNVLAGSQPQNIIQCVMQMQDRKLDFSLDLYGNGKAGNRILNSIIADYAEKRFNSVSKPAIL
jgi:UDP-GlcNAc3NAcA epimerase